MGVGHCVKGQVHNEISIKLTYLTFMPGPRLPPHILTASRDKPGDIRPQAGYVRCLLSLELGTGEDLLNVCLQATATNLVFRLWKLFIQVFFFPPLIFYYTLSFFFNVLVPLM